MTEPQNDEIDQEVLWENTHTSDRLVDNQLRNVQLLEKLSNIPDIEAQIEEVFKTMSADDESMEQTYNSIEKDLNSVLSKVFVEPFTIRPIGSRVLGLQLDSSDIDMNIYFQKRPFKARKCTKMVAEALSKCESFDSVVNLSQARIPIIQCIHKKTGMKCDMNFSFLSGVENSELMKNYLSVDSKLRMVMLVIKYWAKIHNLTDVNRGFSKYTLTMMFIFYLQQYHSLPSVYELQEDTIRTNPNVIWNMNFARIRETPDIKEINSKSMWSLLLGFFSCYTDFDYASCVICPYFGQPMFKNDFKDHTLLQKRFHRQTNCQLKMFKQFITKCNICVQDPLELDRNVSTLVNELNLSRFIIQCSTAREVLRKRTSYMLVELLSPIEELKKYFDLHLYMTTSSVENLKAKHPLEPSFYLRDFWFKQTTNFCTSVFQKILGLKIESEGHFRNNHTYIVSSKQLQWFISRDVDMKMIEKKLKLCTIDSEEDLLNNSSVMSGSSDEPEFKCSIVITSNTELSCMQVEFFRKEGDEDMFSTFANYTCKNLLKWFYKHENYVPNIPEHSE